MVFLPPANEVWVRKYFCTCLSFCSQGGVPGQVPPRQVHPRQVPLWEGTPRQVHPWAGTSRWAGTPPGQVHVLGRYTPLAGTPPGQIHPSPGQVHPQAGTPPGAVHVGRYGQQAGGTHPIGMYSCLIVKTRGKN